MSDAYKCDRCMYYEDDNPVMTVSMKPETGQMKMFELCPQCLSDLHDFMENEPTGKRQ